VKAGTKEYKGNLKKIEDRRDAGMTIAAHKGMIKDSEKAIKKSQAALKKMEAAARKPAAKKKAARAIRRGAAVGQMKTSMRNLRTNPAKKK
jgi:hypothetical protein